MNSKLLKIKELLSSIITTEFKRLATDNGLLELSAYEVGAVVRKVNEDGQETEVEDGVYDSEGYTLTIKDGKIVELIDKKADNTPIEKEEEKVETEENVTEDEKKDEDSVTEETKEETETVETEEVKEESSSSEETESQSDSEQSETETEPAKTEEEVAIVIEETIDPTETDAENLENAIAELVVARARIAELEAKVKELEEALAKPATEEFQNVKETQNTGNKTVDTMRRIMRA